MKKLFLLLLLPLALGAQNTIGLPDVINYSKQSYSAGLQNWDIKQDKNGIIYFANNEGLLSFDGRYWNLYPLPNRTIVRSIEIGSDNRIYVGGQDELGYFAPGTNGRLVYHPLNQLLPARDQSFGDVWDIVSFKKDVFFRTNNRIFKFSNEAVATFKAASEWSFLGICNNKLYAHDFSGGLMQFENNVMMPLVLTGSFPKTDPVTAVLPAANGNILVTTLKNGIYTITGTTLNKFSSPNNSLFENERIYAATRINKDWIALATNNSGVYIIDALGNIIQSFAKAEGLQNNNVLSIFLDNQSNLWLGLDNGIDFIAYNSAVKHLTPYGQDGSGYTARIYNNRLYTGTSNGVFSVSLQQMQDLSFSKGNFTPVSNTKGQTWNLTEINNQLLLGHHEGAFIIKDNTAVPFSSTPGFWNFIPLSTTFPTQKIVSGTYRNLQFFDYKNGQFISAGEVNDLIESCRFVTIDENDHIWVSHPYHGVYEVSPAANGFTNKIYTDKDGLPSILNNHVYNVKSEVVVATEKGVYSFNRTKKQFEPSAFYKKILGDQSIRYLKEDAAGNIWFIHEKTLGVIDLSGKQPVIIYLPELNNKMLSGFEFIYPVNENNIFLGGEKGFYHINYEKYKQHVSNLRVQVRTVRIISDQDSLLFGGYFTNVNEKQEQDAAAAPNVANRFKTIRFEFASPLFGLQPNLEYSYRLKGFDNNWSEWNKRTEKEYTNLPAGNYIFEVKVRNNLGNESAAAVYAFEMLPPWYETTWAYLLYFVLFAAGIYTLYKWQIKKFKEQQAKHEEEQKRLLYIHELERSKTETELVTLRNEKLEVEINFKNSELASSAMHLVKKGELLTKIKSELEHVMKGLDNPKAIQELKKMIKTLSEDDQMDQEWENFTKHFDKVHSDFVVSLKEKHPSITNNEIKLCAYLRMNLSTKEIAQLMNISVRGVEISRYRLRKKLGIASEVSLFDYLINLHSES
ncbi:two component regulator with propeller domain [Lacibacter cauensis]|uniref:Two component regulator with propeller domain n=1 Tax=Lacibacter cauensis TaxID=510947 RepID=A0A562SD86_9BACT|nr:triple tyrosine motif-containing protein [Lacibacter cauensis]TWI79267.1 two component regulator with propeller domain [Lacibacter cauensis]